MNYVLGLKCKECGNRAPLKPLHVCEQCFGPYEVEYDYARMKGKVTRQSIEAGPKSLWRYKDLLPVDRPVTGFHSGFTPLKRADRLGEELGWRGLWIKDDSCNYPTYSYKERVVSVAISKAVEFGFTTVGCASTGNLANSTAANAAQAGLNTYIFVPQDLESAKIIGTTVYGANLIGVKGTYDDVSRLCSQVAERYNWGLVNVNLRPFYAEGSKTFGYEIAEQLGWRVPQHVVSPMAGGSLIGKIHKAFHELYKVGLLDKEPKCKIYGAQATGCNPITGGFKAGLESHKPVRKPNTIAKSLAIGDPADGSFAIKVMRETGGCGEDVTDKEIAEAMLLLAQTEGIFAETAGGVTLAVTQKLIEQGKIPRDEEIVICITGNGLKTQDAGASRL